MAKKTKYVLENLLEQGDKELDPSEWKAVEAKIDDICAEV
jgi:hypothetical protein